MIQETITVMPNVGSTNEEEEARFKADLELKIEMRSREKKEEYEAEYCRQSLLYSRAQRLGMDKAEGIAEGTLMMQQIIARKMLKKDFEIPQIVELTGLTTKEVRELK